MTAVPPRAFGDLLRRSRIVAGLTQEELAEQTGLSVRGISDLERGVNRRPRRETVDLLASALRLSSDERAAFEAAARRGTAPPRQTAAEQPPTNLPAPLTPLIGRAEDVARASRLLRRADVRLLTLTGPGGVGKTRLALQVAGELRGAFADGVFLVGLATLSDPGLVIPTIAQTLGLQETGDEPLPERLQAYVQQREILLLLDNFEHLLAAAPLVTELLAVCPALTVLVTSRAPLRLSGEHEFPVAPLALPELLYLVDIERLARYPAVELFVQRAQAVDSSFQLCSSNAGAVAEICVRLDGLPLAIELAAARVKLLPPEAMVARLERRLQLLTVGARDLPARQRTLCKTLAWSYDLLGTCEQRLFRRLGAFVGGWTLESAEAVCSAGGELPRLLGEGRGEGVDLLEGMASLLDSSFVQPGAETGGMARFTMLETIREYALERLEASGEAEACRRRHALYFLTLVEQAEPRLQSAERIAWCERLEAEHDNIRAALRWSLDGGDPELGLRLIGSLIWFWSWQGYWRGGRAWGEEALARCGALRQTTAWPKAVLATGWLAWLQGDYAAARPWLEESRARFHALDDRRGLAASLFQLGVLDLAQGNHGAARSRFVQSVTLLRELGDRWYLALALFTLGDATVREDQGAARALYEESLALSRAIGDAWGIGTALTALGHLALQEGDCVAARALCEEALALRREASDKWSLATSLTGLGEVVRHQGDAERAAGLFVESLALFRELGNREHVSWALYNLGQAALQQGDVVQAAAHFSESLSLCREQGNLPRLALCLMGLAGIAAMEGHAERAARLCGAAEGLLSALGAPLEPADRVDYDRIMTRIRAALDAATFASMWEAGRALPPERAIAEGLDTVSPPPR